MVLAGPYNHAIEGALVRNLWTGISAWAGLRAADFAPLGLGGMAESIYDVFVGCFGTSADPTLGDCQRLSQTFRLLPVRALRSRGEHEARKAPCTDGTHLQ
jgi:hypothetical protein